ncbi:hypothetical protein ZHAS_00015649 [Anopheles sinensis]|uniref:Uncharacterized protein n=1 Tax=Anopheles sinensis TaxID=74873 RepID=A0A084WB07_ANOSI|nr:hypothetical protein ZHAS_00015649 [Anopheles sinensis]
MEESASLDGLRPTCLMDVHSTYRSVDSAQHAIAGSYFIPGGDEGELSPTYDRQYQTPGHKEERTSGVWQILASKSAEPFRRFGRLSSRVQELVCFLVARNSDSSIDLAIRSLEETLPWRRFRANGFLIHKTIEVYRMVDGER